MVTLSLPAKTTLLNSYVRFLLVLVAMGIVFSSCVSNRKYVYLQKDDVNADFNALPKDTVVRSYELNNFDYRIQPNDLISVRFESLTPSDFDFLSNERIGSTNNTTLNENNALLIGELVDDNGEIMYPILGKVKVSGLTVLEIQTKLQQIAEKYLESPVVKVRLINYRITLLGEVNREGTITLANNRVSILEAIGLAGGLTDLADKSNVKLIRQYPSGKSEVIYLNLLDEDFLESKYYYVYQNDILVAGALKQRPYRKYFGQNLALIVSAISLLLLVINLNK